MKNVLVLALDRTGCLRTARWSEAALDRSRRHSQPRLKRTDGHGHSAQRPTSGQESHSVEGS
jgi:hypothetical protein